jgi:predicted dehydrogenase
MSETPRRNFLGATTAAFTTNLFTGNLRGANDRIAAGFIGTGRMGLTNISHAKKQENLVVAAVCDVYTPNLEKGAKAAGEGVKTVRDFREILADKSIDIVCISTPDHWHAYQTIEACKAGKDVYVEKPISVTIEEGQKMVAAARKYKRVVQAGTMQRSAVHFQKAVEIVKSGLLGDITFVRTWNAGLQPADGIGNPPDSDPPPDLDWEMWLGPAPKRPFNANRFGVDPKAFSHFRWFWDYAGGMMTDWGIHWLDIVQMAFHEAMPSVCMAAGGKFRLKDNRETPDTIQVAYEYPGFLATYENRTGHSQVIHGSSNGILFQGSAATMFLDRSRYAIIPERNSTVEAVEVKAEDSGNTLHWANFLECVRTREKPVSDIELCHKSTSTCHLGNISLRSKLRVDYDPVREFIVQPEARKYFSREARKPWTLKV